MATFKCLFCSNPGDRIAYYSKSYGSKMGHTIENPEITCESCYRSPRIINQLSPMRGGDEGMFSFKFEAIAKWSKKELAWHLSKKFYEINHLSNKHWRKLIWRIYFSYQPRKALSEPTP